MPFLRTTFSVWALLSNIMAESPHGPDTRPPRYADSMNYVRHCGARTWISAYADADHFICRASATLRWYKRPLKGTRCDWQRIERRYSKGRIAPKAFVFDG